jgi:hypothetical protein
MDSLPSVREEVVALFERDEVFRELCEEYLVCSETTARMDTTGSSNNALRREFSALQLRLEGELLRHLKEHRA